MNWFVFLSLSLARSLYLSLPIYGTFYILRTLALSFAIQGLSYGSGFSLGKTQCSPGTEGRCLRMRGERQGLPCVPRADPHSPGGQQWPQRGSVARLARTLEMLYPLSSTLHETKYISHLMAALRSQKIRRPDCDGAWTSAPASNRAPKDSARPNLSFALGQLDSGSDSCRPFPAEMVTGNNRIASKRVAAR